MSKTKVIVFILSAAAAFIAVNCSGLLFFIPKGKILANHFLPDFFLTLAMIELCINYKRFKKNTRSWIPLVVTILFLAIIISFAFLGRPGLVGCGFAILVRCLIALADKQP
jgi:hypothetical protein